MLQDEFLDVEIDKMKDEDIDRAFFILEKIPNDYDECFYIHPTNDIGSNIEKSIDNFNLYKSDSLIKLITNQAKHEILYQEQEEVPNGFNTLFVNYHNERIKPVIIYPKVLDDVSYVFIGHEYHHVLKDSHKSERRIRNRFSEVIPMFYEFMCAEEEKDEEISKEILNRRLNFLTLDKNNLDINYEDRLQYFNSYYYALCLYNRYKKDKILILRLITRVLMCEINTLELLELLNMYDSKLDDIVDDELYDLKEYINR